MKLRNAVLCGAVAFALMTVAASRAGAGIPRIVSLKGELSDAADQPITGLVSITFRVYDVQTGGAALWSETQSVTADEGVYTVLLGSVTSLDLPFDADYWLSIEVEADGEMSPRLRMASSPYAYRARSAETADAAADSDTVDGMHASEFMPAAVDNWVDTSGDTMAGALTLSGDPAGPLEAATKQYVDNSVVAAGGVVDSVVAGAGIVVDSADPANPVVSLVDGTAADEVLKWDGSAWVLATDEIGILAEADTLQTVRDRGSTVLVAADGGDAIDVRNTSSTNGSVAVRGYATAGTGITYGVYGQSQSTAGYGVFADSGNVGLYATGTNKAAEFAGAVDVTGGGLTVNAGGASSDPISLTAGSPGAGSLPGEQPL